MMTPTLKPDFSLPVDDTLTLRLATVDDTEELFRLIDTNRAYLRTHLGWVDMTKKASDTKKYVEENFPLWLSLKALHLLICKNNAIIGSIGLHNINMLNKGCEIGYWIDQNHQGQGIMTTCIKALLEYLFHTLKLHRIELRCALDNTKSQNIAKRLGFKEEAVLQDALFHNGTYFDTYLYALINPLKT
jgi:ribosomal-protein-serine acetyltransferase